jgi:peptidoglycan/LPS O-acetylase OafA/YrhL
MDDDPTKVTNQPALTSSTGRIWLIVGGLMTAIALVLLWSLQQLRPPGVAFTGFVVVALLYIAMVEVRLLTEPGRRRLMLMAVCFGLIALVALVAVLIIGFAQTPT